MSLKPLAFRRPLNGTLVLATVFMAKDFQNSYIPAVLYHSDIIAFYDETI
jgi:hypothetical protein